MSGTVHQYSTVQLVTYNVSPVLGSLSAFTAIKQLTSLKYTHILGIMESFICLEEIYEVDFVTQRIDIEANVDEVLVKDRRVIDNMLSLEKSYSVVDYCERLQTEIAPHMRKIVTDWMLEVCQDQQSQPEVFFLAVNYLDRFLSSVNIKKNQFQLLASVCILLASKFSQVVPITTDQLIIYSDNSITKDELKNWELFVLEILGWELSTSTAHSFLDHFCNSEDMKQCNTNVIRRQAETIAALAATEYKFITTKQSIVAAAALAAAVQQTVEDQAVIENVVKQAAVMIKCLPSEILFYQQHVAEFSSNLPKMNLPTKEYNQEYNFPDTKTLHSTETSILPITPTDSYRVFEVMAA